MVEPNPGINSLRQRMIPPDRKLSTVYVDRPVDKPCGVDPIA